MSVESALYSYLGGVSAVTALVSTRIYPSQAPQGAALPYVVHHKVSERRFPNVAGPSGMVRARHQIDVFGATLDSAQSVAETLRNNLDGWRHTVMGAEQLNVLSIDLDDVRSDFTPPNDGGDPGTHRVTGDYVFLYAETGTAV